MRLLRADLNRKLLCPGVDLPIEAGTCGRLIAPESSRRIRCHNRRMWLLKYGLNQAEIAITALLETAAAEDEARRDPGAPVHLPDAVPLLDDLSVRGSRRRQSGRLPHPRPGERRRPAAHDRRPRGVDRHGGRLADGRRRPVRADDAGKGRRCAAPQAAGGRVRPRAEAAQPVRALHRRLAARSGPDPQRAARARRPRPECARPRRPPRGRDRAQRHRPRALAPGRLQGAPRYREGGLARPLRPAAVEGRRAVGTRAWRHRDRQPGPAPASARALRGCRRRADERLQAGPRRGDTASEGRAARRRARRRPPARPRPAPAAARRTAARPRPTTSNRCRTRPLALGAVRRSWSRRHPRRRIAAIRRAPSRRRRCGTLGGQPLTACQSRLLLHVPAAA